MAKTPLLITAPAEEPVSIDELKDHCAVTDADDDRYIYELGVAARTWIEQTTWRALCTQTWDQYFDSFASAMFLRKPPLVTGNAITHVKYTNTSGTLTTVGSSVYETGDQDGVPLLRCQYNQQWPSDVRGHDDAVVVRTICGYGSTAGTAGDVPATLKHANKILDGDMYENRESGVTGRTVARVPVLDALLAPYRVRHDVC